MQESVLRVDQQVGSQKESIFNITIEGFMEVQKAGISLDQLFLLECFSEGTDVSKHIHSSKVLAWKQSLERKGFINDGGYLTVAGKNLLDCMRKGESFSSLQTTIKQSTETDFDVWWSKFPSTDVWDRDGVKFNGTRGLKQKKDECKKKFYDIINQGTYTANDLIKALETEILIKKDASVREKENKLKYMSNSLTYLTNQGFIAFLELSKTYKSPAQTNNGTDI